MTTSCPICGAPADPAAATCAFDVPEDQAPWRGDYEAMHQGRMTHAEHQVLVARWIQHHPGTLSPPALMRMRHIAEESRGRHVVAPPRDQTLA